MIQHVGLFAFQQVARNSFADLAPDGVDPFVTASQNSDDELKTDFVIDIAAAAEALAGGGATQAQKIEAQLWLTRNIGVEPAKDVDGEVVVGVAVRTRDSGNLADGQDGLSIASTDTISVAIRSHALMRLRLLLRLRVFCLRLLSLQRFPHQLMALSC